MPRIKDKEEEKADLPEQRRAAYVFDVEQLNFLKALVKKYSTAKQPVTISGLLDEAINLLREKYNAPNGTRPKTKQATG